MSYLGIFGQEFENTTVIFEISPLEFVIANFESQRCLFLVVWATDSKNNGHI